MSPDVFSREDDDTPVRKIYSPDTAPIPGFVPPLCRTLFAQDLFYEDEPIRPIYGRTMELWKDYTPPASPSAATSGVNVSSSKILIHDAESPSTPPGRTIMRSDDVSDSGSESSPQLIPVFSPPGKVEARALAEAEAIQEISCEYSQIHNTYLQYIQFALRSPDPEFEAERVNSPRAIFRTWTGNPNDPNRPFWIKYCSTGSALRVVPFEFAIGRIILLAHVRENILISDRLIEWAKQFHPDPFLLEYANRRYIADEAPEDTEDPKY